MIALHHRRSIAFLLLACFGLLAWACTGSSSQTVQPAQPAVSPSTAPQATDTPAPTLTPPSPVERAVLLAPPGSDAQLASDLQTSLAPLAQQAGLVLQVLPSLQPEDLQSGVRLVVALPPDPGLAALAAAAPKTAFLSIAVPNLPSAPNLAVLGAQGSRPDQRGFLAGYIAAAITEDWRVGVLSAQEPAVGKAARRAYANGVAYFCGLCRSVYPPFPPSGYPVISTLSGVDAPAEWPGAIGPFKAWDVRTVYVDPSVSSPDLINFLADEGFQLIGTGLPPEQARDQWVVSLDQGDLLQMVQEAWRAMLAGEPGKVIELPLELRNANPELFSPGRQRLTEEMLPGLLSGFIDTGVNPETGELR